VKRNDEFLYAGTPGHATNKEASTPVKVVNNSNSANALSNSMVASSWPGARAAIDSPGSVNQLSSSPGSAASFTPESGFRKRLKSTSSVLETVSPTVKMVIEVRVFLFVTCGQNRQKNSLKECVKNTLLQTAFLAILPTGFICTHICETIRTCIKCNSLFSFFPS